MQYLKIRALTTLSKMNAEHIGFSYLCIDVVVFVVFIIVFRVHWMMYWMHWGMHYRHRCRHNGHRPGFRWRWSGRNQRCRWR